MATGDDKLLATMFGIAFPVRAVSGEIIVPSAASRRSSAAEPWRVRRVVRSTATESYDASDSSPHGTRSMSDTGMRGRLIDILV